MVRNLALMVAEIVRVLVQIPEVEVNRRLTSPQKSARAARRRAVRAPARSSEDRERLRRAVAVVDRWMPGGGNCLRRSLLEMSLDAGAARERLLAGFKAGGAPASGHAWLESQPVSERYDAIIPI
jgi:hypothetical protein